MHGGEAILPTHWSSGGTMAAPTIINLTLNGSLLTSTNVIDVIHTGLLEKKRRNRTLGLA